MATKKRRVPTKQRRRTKRSYTLVVQKWFEFERGYGARPDGYSLHLSESDRTAYIRAYFDTMPKEAPDVYSQPMGPAYLADVDAKTYRKVAKSKNGTSQVGSPPPVK